MLAKIETALATAGPAETRLQQRAELIRELLMGAAITCAQ